MIDRLRIRPVQISDAERLARIYSYYVNETAVSFEYEDINFKKQRQKFTGFTAQIVQHEVDHLEGIII